MFFKHYKFTNYVILTNNLNCKFLLTLMLVFNLFFFFKTQNSIKKILSTIFNLLILTCIILQKSNEAFAYLFLITELTAILVLMPILFSKNNEITNEKSLNLNIYFLITFFTTSYIIYNYNFNTKYNIFVDSIKEGNNNFNDLYSLFLILNYNHSL